MKRDRSLKTLAFVLLAAFLFGCVSASRPSGFLENYALTEQGNFFAQEYRTLGAELSNYRKVKVAPVILEYLDTESQAKAKEEDLVRLADLLKKHLEESLALRYIVLSDDEKADSQTMEVLAALTHLKIPNRAANVVTSALIFIPVTSGSAAVEIKMIDSQSGEVLAQLAEKRTGAKDAKSLTVGPFMKYAHTEAIFRKWSENLLSFLDGKTAKGEEE